MPEDMVGAEAFNRLFDALEACSFSDLRKIIINLGVLINHRSSPDADSNSHLGIVYADVGKPAVHRVVAFAAGDVARRLKAAADEIAASAK